MNEGKGWIWGGVAMVAVLVVGGWLYMAHQHAQQQVLTVAAPAVASSTSRAPAHYPISMAGSAAPAAASSAPLPALNDDHAILDAISALPSGKDLATLLRPRDLIAHLVATIDALPGRTLGDSVYPVHRPKGDFLVQTQDGTTTIDPANAARYAPYMRVVEAVPTQALVGWYVHDYPLFQKAYQQLGYPHGYFNDRLIVVIDDLLATPDRATPPTLVEGKSGNWDYADPSLQSLSIGQRMLLRTGAADEAAIKAKLRAIRADLAGQSLPPR